jgi:hypothetical protein
MVVNRLRLMKVDRVLANHSLSSTASQGTSNIPFPSLLLGCNRQAKTLLGLVSAVTSSSREGSRHRDKGMFLEVYRLRLLGPRGPGERSETSRWSMVNTFFSFRTSSAPRNEVFTDHLSLTLTPAHAGNSR